MGPVNGAVIGLELSRLRKEAGLTQVEVARRMGTTQPAIARAETGWTTLPSLEWLDRYARAVGKPLVLRVGVAPTADELAARSDRVLGPDFEQNPWDRDPSEVEARGLDARGLTRDRFKQRRRSAA